MPSGLHVDVEGHGERIACASRAIGHTQLVEDCRPSLLKSVLFLMSSRSGDHSLRGRTEGGDGTVDGLLQH